MPGDAGRGWVRTRRSSTRRPPGSSGWFRLREICFFVKAPAPCRRAGRGEWGSGPVADAVASRGARFISEPAEESRGLRGVPRGPERSSVLPRRLMTPSLDFPPLNCAAPVMITDALRKYPRAGKAGILPFFRQSDQMIKHLKQPLRSAAPRSFAGHCPIPSLLQPRSRRHFGG